MGIFSKFRAPLHQAIGEAIEEYSYVEVRMAAVLGILLKVDLRKSHVVFFAVFSMRSRLELIEALIDLQMPKDLKQDFAKFWNSCTRYFQALAKFRNALAHWHPHTNLYVKHTAPGTVETKHAAALGHPVYGKGAGNIEVEDIPAFIADCQYGGSILSELESFLKRKRKALPEKFRQPIPRQNQASLLPLQTPTKRRPQRKPSTPKLSPKQKRAKALKDARKKKKD